MHALYGDVCYGIRDNVCALLSVGCISFMWMRCFLNIYMACGGGSIGTVRTACKHLYKVVYTVHRAGDTAQGHSISVTHPPHATVLLAGVTYWFLFVILCVCMCIVAAIFTAYSRDP